MLVNTTRLMPIAKRLVKSGAIIYLLVCLLIAAFQTSLIFPGSFRQGSPDVQIDPPPGMQLVHLQLPAPSDRQSANPARLVALWTHAKLPNGADDPLAHTRPTVLYFYGNGDSLAGSLYHLDLFSKAGANCIAIDYPGFGMSQGKPSESGCYAAAEAAYQYLLTRNDINPHLLVPAGWSLGGAVAIDLAWRHKNEGTIAGLMTFCTFTSMLDMAKLNYPFLPVSLLLQHHFKSAEKAADLHLPWLIAHGRSDRAIPYAMADRLAAATPSPTTRFYSESADHADFFEVAHDDLKPALRTFLERLTAS